MQSLVTRENRTLQLSHPQLDPVYERLKSNLLSIWRNLRRTRDRCSPPPFFEESAGSGAKVLLLGYEAVDGFVGEKISMIPRLAKATDPGVALLWVLGAERNRIS